MGSQLSAQTKAWSECLLVRGTEGQQREPSAKNDKVAIVAVAMRQTYVATRAHAAHLEEEDPNKIWSIVGLFPGREGREEIGSSTVAREGVNVLGR